MAAVICVVQESVFLDDIKTDNEILGKQYKASRNHSFLMPYIGYNLLIVLPPPITFSNVLIINEYNKCYHLIS